MIVILVKWKQRARCVEDGDTNLSLPVVPRAPGLALGCEISPSRLGVLLLGGDLHNMCTSYFPFIKTLLEIGEDKLRLFTFHAFGCMEGEINVATSHLKTCCRRTDTVRWGEAVVCLCFAVTCARAAGDGVIGRVVVMAKRRREVKLRGHTNPTNIISNNSY